MPAQAAVEARHGADRLRHIELLGGAARRARHPPTSARHRQFAASRRLRHALGRSGSRQDHARAHAHPLSRRRPGDRGAEPDLHADADLRPAAISVGSCRPLPPVGTGGARRARLRRLAGGRGGAARMARPRGRLFAARSARRFAHARAQAQARIPPCPRHRLWRAGGARRPHGGGAPIHRRERLQRGAARAAARRRLDPVVRAARARRPARAADEFPRRPDGPPVRGDKPYSAIAHLAENVVPFVAMANGLRRLGLSAPVIHHADLDQGFLILEDLDDERVVSSDPAAPVVERYETAVDVLLALHAQPLPDTLPVAPQLDYRIPPYDMNAFLIEAELLVDWFLPRLDAAIPDTERGSFRALWRELLQPVIDAPPTWVLRDFHSPNLLWLPQRSELARLGLLDLQDAVMGPPAYDLASLLQDARVDVTEETELALLGRYVRGRGRSEADFNGAEFIKSYVTLAAQRASKILGIFARLDLRDGKPQYLRHLPRVWGYLQRSLSHPALEALNAWYIAHVPALNTI